MSDGTALSTPTGLFTPYYSNFDPYYASNPSSSNVLKILVDPS